MSFPSGGFGALEDEVEEGFEIFLALVDIFPFKLIGVGTRSCVAASTADEDLAELFGFSWDFAGWVLFHEGFLGHDYGLAIDSGQGIEVKARCYIKLVLHFEISNLNQGLLR